MRTDQIIWASFRMVDAGLALACAVLMVYVMALRVQDKQLNGADANIRIGIVLYLAGGAYSTLNLHKLDAPGGPWLVLLTTGLIVLLIGLLRTLYNRRNDRKARDERSSHI